MASWTIVHTLCPQMFPREYWSGVPIPCPRHLPDPGIKPASLVSPVSSAKLIYLFGCVRFQLQHLGFSLHHVGPFLVVYRLSELWCGLNSWQQVGCRACRFQQLWQVSLVTLQHVESWIPSWGSNSHPCIGR